MVGRRLGRQRVHVWFPRDLRTNIQKRPGVAPRATITVDRFGIMRVEAFFRDRAARIAFQFPTKTVLALANLWRSPIEWDRPRPNKDSPPSWESAPERGGHVLVVVPCSSSGFPSPSTDQETAPKILPRDKRRGRSFARVGPKSTIQP